MGDGDSLPLGPTNSESVQRLMQPIENAHNHNSIRIELFEQIHAFGLANSIALHVLN